MNQEHLERALQRLGELESRTDGDLKQQLMELRGELQAAQRQGEGQEAAALRQALQEMNQQNSEFVSVMVHEIRKPMTSIRGYTDMLVRNLVGELNEMQSQMMTTIRNNVLSMEQLVTDISDVSKFRAGRIKPNPKMEMFKNIAMQLEKDFAEAAKTRGIELTFDIPQGLPLLNLDAGRVEQALRKLLDNAIKYTPTGGKVKLSAEGLGNKLRITIQDTGVGISDADQKRLGELFFRGDQELVTQTKGYGMGLAIALACMELVGGELRWQSSIGEGSTFEMILPAVAS